MSKYFIYSLFVLAFFLRLSRLVPNMELVTTAMLLSSLYLSRSATLKLTFLLMAATDLFLGNTSIFLFTWSGFLLPVLIISKLKNYFHSRSAGFTSISNFKFQIILASFVGLFSNLFFFLWTNFGVWLLDSWGMYPKTSAGLISCYINGLPFLRPQMASTLLFVPTALIIYRYISSLKPKYTLHKSLQV